MDSFLGNIFYTMVCVCIGWVLGQLFSIETFRKWLGPKQ